MYLINKILLSSVLFLLTKYLFEFSNTKHHIYSFYSLVGTLTLLTHYMYIYKNKSDLGYIKFYTCTLL